MRSTVLHESIDESDLVFSFPIKAREAATSVVSRLPHAETHPVGRIPIQLAGESLFLPYRIYNEPIDEPSDRILRTIHHCLYSCHHDGHVREASIARAISISETLVVPFVILLLSGYPIEIHKRIALSLANSSLRDEAFNRFSANNPEFMALAHSRALSYHAVYYRSLARNDYPALRLLESWSP